MQIRELFYTFVATFIKSTMNDNIFIFDESGTILKGVKDQSIKSIVIPNSVTSIGACAFYSCTGLTSVTIGNSVTSIGDEAFRGCSRLTSISIPKSVTNIGDGAFAGCSGLTSITIPDSVTSIGSDAFKNCTSLTSIDIPESVTSIGDGAFGRCSGLTYVKIPDGVTSIGDWAFYGCSSLTSINIPDGVTSIGGATFEDCYGLTSIDIPNSVTSIGNWAFAGCSGLTSITIPDSVTSIGYGAFSGCSSLTSVNIPNSVASIGETAFSGCDSLISINVDPGNSLYDSRGKCNAIIETSANKLICGCKNTVIPNNVKSIGDYAFNNCSGLISIDIPNSVTSIGMYAFNRCEDLTTVAIPNSVTGIGSGAFQLCSSLTSVTIPDSVTSIGNNAFYACSALTSINVPDGVTTIGESAFENIHVLSIIRILAKKLKCQYSFEKNLNSQNKKMLIDGIIYQEGKPFIIIEEKRFINKKKDEREVDYLGNIQDRKGILWCIIYYGDILLLRHFNDKFIPYTDVIKIAQAINAYKEDTISHFSKESYLEEIKKQILQNHSDLSQKDCILKFVDNLCDNDIVLEDDGIYFTDIKETDFFMSLLIPVKKDLIWRYTTKNSLFLLLRDHNQNMLSLNCMNDISEIDYADKYIDPEACNLMKSIDEANKVFIMSCCDETKSDDLMMWRLYAQDGEGVSLCYHIDTSKIDNKYFYIANVCYGRQKKKHPELDLIMTMLNSLFHGRHFKFHNWLVWKHFFKPYEFNYENEIRLIYLEQDISLAKNTIWIEDSKSGIASPMKLFCLEKGYTPQFPLSLIKVIIGPKSKESGVNLIQFRKMYDEAKISNMNIEPDFQQSEIDLYR